MTQEKKKLSFWQIWNMSFGFLGIQFGFALQGGFMSRIFQTLGAEKDAIPFLWIAAPLTGLLAQPIVGYLSDRTGGTEGRRRPWLFWGALVSAVSFFGVFTVPFVGPWPSMTEGEGLLAALYVLAALLLYTTGYSLFNVPYMAMPAEMTTGYHERSSIHGWRVMFASVSSDLKRIAGTRSNRPVFVDLDSQ